MNKLTLNDIEAQNLILYKYIRGSHLYGLNTPNSDIDTGGIFYSPIEYLIGLGTDYLDEISDVKHDNVMYELKKFFNLINVSNPTILEALFVDEKHILFESKVMQYVKSYKNEFLTKQIYMPFVGYAESQIKKATGLHKLCQCPITERKTPIDFCYTYYKQGSSSISNFLAKRGMKQDFCGLVNINHMQDNYSVFYDWGGQFYNDNIQLSDLINSYKNKEINDPLYCMVSLIIKVYDFDMTCDIIEQLSNWYEKYKTPFCYRGIQKQNGNDVRYSSVVKNEPPICYMSYNRDAYTHHCKKYKEYQTWVSMRNQTRYEENKEKTWDSKNVMHCIRLLTMANEILNGDGFILDRKLAGDSDFLMRVRNHEFEYDYVLDVMNSKLDTVKQTFAITKLKDSVDISFTESLLITIRKYLYFNKTL